MQCSLKCKVIVLEFLSQVFFGKKELLKTLSCLFFVFKKVSCSVRTVYSYRKVSFKNLDNLLNTSALLRVSIKNKDLYILCKCFWISACLHKSCFCTSVISWLNIQHSCLLMLRIRSYFVPDLPPSFSHIFCQ